MKEIKIQVSNISPGQWSTLLLELNSMSKSWRRFGPDIKLQAQKKPQLNDIRFYVKERSKKDNRRPVLTI